MGSLLGALVVVFVAELGDKTQLVALGFGARHRLGPVLAGVISAYAATNLVSVLAGGLVGAALPTRAVGLVGGVLFCAFAVWTLTEADGEADGAGPVGASSLAVFRTVAVAMFVAELGDKTMLATATLAARGDPVLVWIGATAGIVASGTLGVLVGRAAGARLPVERTRTASAVLFALFGVVMIVTNL